MKSFHFTFGNSTDGPIGYCARIIADNDEQAVARLKELVEQGGELLEIHARLPALYDAEGEYITAFLNADAITAKAIDSEDEIPDEL